MHTVAVVIFALSYLGIAFGSIPGLALDRTGFALLGAIAMIAAGVLGVHVAVESVDVPTILLLYALMVISAQFRLGGFYTWTALRITHHLEKPERFLALLMGVSALFSAILANDIVCLAFTPVLAVALLRARLNPIPFLLGLAAASNIGSAATIIGNPQNMLIGQVLHLEFGAFLLWCLPPALLALAAAYGIILWLYRGRFHAAVESSWNGAADWPSLNRWQSGKGLLVTAVVMALFFTRIPRELTAITAAGILLCSRRMKSRALLGLVDWHLITLFCGLFIIVRGIEQTGLPATVVDTLGQRGLDLHNLYALTGVSVILSNLVSNVPATMLLVKFADAAKPVEGYVLALSSTFAGNLLTIGSIANLIVIEQAKSFGIEISFREHARTGIPVTLASLLVLGAWIWISHRCLS